MRGGVGGPPPTQKVENGFSKMGGGARARGGGAGEGGRTCAIGWA
jgi:hypothetical protein